MIRALRGLSEVSFACAGCGHPRPAFFVYDCIYIWGLYFVCRLRGSVPGVVLASPRGSHARSWCSFGVLFYAQAAAICVRKHLTVTPAREPLQSQGFPGLVWALLGSTGLFWGLLAFLGSPGFSWARLGSPGLFWAHLGSPGLVWASLGCLGLVWALLGSLGLSWALLGSPELS